MTKKNILMLITVFLFILLLGFANNKHFDTKHEQLAKEISSNILVGEVVDSYKIITVYLPLKQLLLLKMKQYLQLQ